MDNCLFCKIASGALPAKIVFQDEHAVAFWDIAPATPTHLLLIPRRHIASLAEVTGQDTALLGHLLTLAPHIARDQGLTDGFRTIINTGRIGGQEVYHLHIHILGGPERLPGLIAKS